MTSLYTVPFPSTSRFNKYFFFTKFAVTVTSEFIITLSERGEVWLLSEYSKYEPSQSKNSYSLDGLAVIFTTVPSE